MFCACCVGAPLCLLLFVFLAIAIFIGHFPWWERSQRMHLFCVCFVGVPLRLPLSYPCSVLSLRVHIRPLILCLVVCLVSLLVSTLFFTCFVCFWSALACSPFRVDFIVLLRLRLFYACCACSPQWLLLSLLANFALSFLALCFCSSVFRFACCYFCWSVVSLVFLCSVLVVLVLCFACCFLCFAIAIFIGHFPWWERSQRMHLFCVCFVGVPFRLPLRLPLSYPCSVLSLRVHIRPLISCLVICLVSLLVFTSFACFVCLFLVCLALRSLSR